MSSLEIVSYNVNGIRSAVSKGLADWIRETAYDVYLFQETKAHEYDIPVEIFEELGYRHHWFSAQKKGYSGVGILVKTDHSEVVKGMGNARYDAEGRVIRMDIGDITIVNSYFPSGSSGDERQSVKMDYLRDFHQYIHELMAEIHNTKKRMPVVLQTNQIDKWLNATCDLEEYSDIAHSQILDAQIISENKQKHLF